MYIYTEYIIRVVHLNLNYSHVIFHITKNKSSLFKRKSSKDL